MAELFNELEMLWIRGLGIIEVLSNKFSGRTEEDNAVDQCDYIQSLSQERGRSEYRAVLWLPASRVMVLVFLLVLPEGMSQTNELCN